MRAIFSLFVISLSIFLVSCGGKKEGAQSLNPQVSGEMLSGPALDAIDISIVMYVQRSAFNPVTLSSGLRQRVDKYGEGTTFDMSMKGIMQMPVKNGTKIVIPLGGEFTCTYKGKLNFIVKFIEGKVGIINGDIFVKDGTRSQIDSDSYIFRSGKWRKIK